LKPTVETDAQYPLDTAQLITRVDSLIRELLEIRRQLALVEALHGTEAKTKHWTKGKRSLTDQLFGAMGHGDWSEYDQFTDYERFSR